MRIRRLFSVFAITVMCTPGTSSEDLRCDERWDEVAATFADAGELRACEGADAAVARSLLVVEGLTIDNDGTEMHPCVAVLCDDNYAYISSNNLPHYDFVPITPNPLAEVATFVRLPLAPARPGAQADADPVEIQEGCVDAYVQHLADPEQATEREPSGLCSMGADDAPYLSEALASGEAATYAKINCLGTTAIMVSGATIAGPNEANTPDPYGDPFFYMPNTAGEDYLDSPYGVGPALDLCGGHTGGSMHYHGANAACFARAEDGRPARSYAAAGQAWDLDAMLQGACSEPSGIVGWSPDGYPIKGPCVCVDAACTEVKRARSAWVYAGLEAWGDDPDEDDRLAVENRACSSDDDCCEGEGCNFRCAPLVVADGDGTAIESRCALLDYSWCTHRYVDRSAEVEQAEYVYLDRCNGHDGPDGYAYHATASFPYFQACYRGQPAEIPAGDMGGGGMDMGGEMPPAACAAGQTAMCCGDGRCDGPETADSCAADC